MPLPLHAGKGARAPTRAPQGTERTGPEKGAGPETKPSLRYFEPASPGPRGLRSGKCSSDELSLNANAFACERGRVLRRAPRKERAGPERGALARPSLHYFRHVSPEPRGLRDRRCSGEELGLNGPSVNLAKAREYHRMPNKERARGIIPPDDYAAF